MVLGGIADSARHLILEYQNVGDAFADFLQCFGFRGDVAIELHQDCRVAVGEQLCALAKTNCFAVMVDSWLAAVFVDEPAIAVAATMPVGHDLRREHRLIRRLAQQFLLVDSIEPLSIVLQ